MIMGDIEDLISEVEKYPCLWDTSCDYYQNKMQRDKAWGAIYRVLTPNYNQLPGVDKKEIGENIRKQWNNIRDGYKKYLNRSLNVPEGTSIKRYIYADNLDFLKPILLRSRQEENTEEQNKSKVNEMYEEYLYEEI